MRAAVLQVVCCAAVAATASAAANCSNPVFQGEGLFGAPALTLRSGAPKPFPENAQADDYPCSVYAGEDSCCSNKTLEQIDFYFALGDYVLNQTGMLIQDNDYPSKFEQLVSAQMTLLCSFVNKNLFPTLSQDCDQASDLVTKYSKEMSQAAQDVAEAELKCAEALSAYYKGVLCFACEKDWDQYLVSEAGIFTALNLNDNTCTSIVDQCTPVNTGVHTVANVAVEFVEALLDMFSGGSWSFNLDVNALVDSLPDACGGTMGSPGDCTQFYCNSSAVSGMQTPTQSNWGFLNNNNRALEALQAAASSNMYTATGYDAYGVGAADVHTLEMQPWAIALIAVAVVVVIAGVVAGVLLVRRRRATSRSVQYSTSEKETAPSTTTYGSLGDGSSA